eukprot:3707825-Amphidinium_carterae.1
MPGHLMRESSGGSHGQQQQILIDADALQGLGPDVVEVASLPVGESSKTGAPKSTGAKLVQTSRLETSPRYSQGAQLVVMALQKAAIPSFNIGKLWEQDPVTLGFAQLGQIYNTGGVDWERAAHTGHSTASTAAQPAATRPLREYP